MSQYSRHFRKQALALRTRARAEAPAALREDYEHLAAVYEALAREIESIDRLLSCLTYLGTQPL